MDANALLVGKKTKEAQKSKAVPAKQKGSTGKRNICSVFLYVWLGLGHQSCVDFCFGEGTAVGC